MCRRPHKHTYLNRKKRDRDEDLTKEHVHTLKYVPTFFDKREYYQACYLSFYSCLYYHDYFILTEQ